MRLITWRLTIGYPTADREGEFSIDDDASDEEIEEAVRNDVHEYIEWSWEAEPVDSEEQP
jgi:hypothetical protein